MSYIAIIDYSVGNIFSIERLMIDAKLPYKIINNVDDIHNSTLLLLPGVGSFDDVLTKFRNYKHFTLINDLVLNHDKPVLGICVGMQMMCSSSDEGQLPGLSWIENSTVTKFNNTVFYSNYGPQFTFFPDINDLSGNYYYLHSYFCTVPEQYIIAQSFYNNIFTSGFKKNNIYGFQFHPEKSHNIGIKLIRHIYESFI